MDKVKNCDIFYSRATRNDSIVINDWCNFYFLTLRSGHLEGRGLKVQIRPLKSRLDTLITFHDNSID